MPRPFDPRYDHPFPGSELTPEQVAFARAMERYMRRRRRPCPAWHEVLAVLASLGYRRVADPADAPADCQSRARSGAE